MLKVLDLIFATRPLLLLPAWGFYLIGAADTAGRYEGAPSLDKVGLLAFISLSFVLAGNYVLNLIPDHEEDRINRKGLYHLGDSFLRRHLIILGVVLIVPGVIVALLVPLRSLLLLVAALVLALAYSLPPAQLSRKPVVDLLANALGYGFLAPLLGAAAVIGSGDLPWLETLPYAFLVASVFLHTTLLDLKGDSRVGKKTTGVVLGWNTTRALALVLFLIAGYLALRFSSGNASILVLVSSPFLLLSTFGPRDRWSSTYCQATTLFVALLAVYHYPQFVPLFAFVILAASLYHRKRFHVSYPGF